MSADWGREIPNGFFDEERHIYRNRQGVRVPSVTQVFDLLGFTDFSGVPAETLEWKREFGTSVHKAVELLVEGDLDWDSCDERAVPAICGVEQKLKQMQFVGQASEESRIYNLHGMEYGGSLDHRGTCVHQGVERRCVIDLKTACKAEAYWKWQVAAYTVGLDGAEKPVNSKPWLGVVLQVGKEGDVKPFYYDTYTGLREFQILLSTVILGINNGLYKLGNGNG